MDDKLERYMDAAADLHGIPLDPSYRKGVLLFLGIARDAYDDLSAFDLPGDTEPAPRFEP